MLSVDQLAPLSDTDSEKLFTPRSRTPEVLSPTSLLSQKTKKSEESSQSPSRRSKDSKLSTPKALSLSSDSEILSEHSTTLIQSTRNSPESISDADVGHLDPVMSSTKVITLSA